jgi:hypothetical protein
MPDDTRLQTALATAIEPALPLSNLAPGDCVRGYVTFEPPQGESPKFVLFEQSTAPPIKWAI